jgi:hypothetical protein
MDPTITNYLSKLEFCEKQVFKNMVVIPLLTSVNHGPENICLGEALKQGVLTITEVHEGGTVPELKVINRGGKPVLLLDGEELAGAKQNRVLNTTILLKENSETIIPVSCTEQGRWAYTAREFAASGNIMNRNVRMKKASSVSRSLDRSHAYASDQGEVWNGIAFCRRVANVDSRTGAMSDLFKSRQDDLNGYLAALQYVPHQKGILVTISGKVAGFDIVSLSPVYQMVHSKLIKSYALDALLQKEKDGDEATINKARSFIEGAAGCEDKKYKSVGHGWDHRFEGKGMVGSALVHEENVIHMAFFSADESEKVGKMSSSSRRRTFRSQY